MPRVSLGGVIFVCLLLQLSSAQGASSETDPRKPGTVRMAGRLAELVKTADRVTNPFFNEGKIAALQGALLTNPPPKELPGLRFTLGKELLAAGKNEEALNEFRWVYETSRNQGALFPENKI